MISGSFVDGQVNKIRHYVLNIILFLLWDQCVTNQVNNIGHYVLGNSLVLLEVPLVLDQWFKQTLCVRFNGPMSKSRHSMLSILLVLLRDHSVMNWWVKSETMC